MNEVLHTGVVWTSHGSSASVSIGGSVAENCNVALATDSHTLPPHLW